MWSRHTFSLANLEPTRTGVGSPGSRDRLATSPYPPKAHNNDFGPWPELFLPATKPDIFTWYLSNFTYKKRNIHLFFIIKLTILWCNCRFGHMHKGVAKVDNYFWKVYDELLSCAGLPNELVTAAFLACRFKY